MAIQKSIIDRINYVAGYVVNETPKYRPIIDSSSFDSIPNMGEADAAPPEAAANTPAPQQAAPPSSGSTGAPSPTAAPSMPPPEAAMSEPTPAPSGAPAPAQAATPPSTAPSLEPQSPAAQQQTTDQLQADVLRFQLDAMKKMTQKIDQLENMVSSLNSQNAELHKEVDKVRDPSDVEKFANRKQDSSPYYFNLNDMWNGNTFQARMDNFNSKGIVKTEDGYVADFDQLPKLSGYQLKDSFEQI
jgi:outer membrane murein-binding lipoprotein Lpp